MSHHLVSAKKIGKVRGRPTITYRQKSKYAKSTSTFEKFTVQKMSIEYVEELQMSFNSDLTEGNVFIWD